MDKAYEQHIESIEWNQIRNLRKNFDGNKCRNCGCTIHLEVHHKNYDNFGNEDIKKDLITLCKDCHDEITKASRTRYAENKEYRINNRLIKNFNCDQSTFWW